MAIRQRAGAMAAFPPWGWRFFSRRALVVVAGVLAACGRDSTPETHHTTAFVVDDAGRRVPLAPSPRRIVSLLPSATELLIELDAGDRLVARTGYDLAPALAHLPSLGETLAPSVERIVALRPDLVITPPDALAGGLAARLESAGLRVYAVDAQRLDEALSTFARLSRLVGAAGRGEVLEARTRAELEALRRETAGRPRVRVLYLLWHEPLSVAGRNTYVHDLLEVAGGENAFADVDGWGSASLEEVIAREIDVVVIPRSEQHSLQPDWLTGSARWRAVRAVREGRLVAVESDLFNRPGPRVAEAARVLAAALHAGAIP